MTFFGTIFYLFGIIALVWEAYCIIDIEKTHNFSMRFCKKTKKTDFLDDYSTTEKTFAFWQFGYWIWAFVGLIFSFQWSLFVLLIVMSLIKKKTELTRMIDSGISFCIILFMLVNYFHLHIPLF